MNNDFDKEAYTKAANRIKLSNEQKKLLISDMKNAAKYRTAPQSTAKKPTYRRSTLSVLAAALAIVLVFFGTLFFAHKSKSQNSFVLTANAQSTVSSELSSKGLQNEISINCGQYGNLILQKRTDSGVENYKDKDGNENVLISFKLTSLQVQGDNIKSVDFSTNTKRQYFGILSSSNLTGGALNNSSYSENELKTYVDGDGSEYADSFSCENLMLEKIIVLDNKVCLVSESNRSIPEQDELVTRYFELNSRILEEKTKLYYQTGGTGGSKTPQALEDLYNELSECTEKLLKIEFSNATMDVSVTFDDDTVLTKTFALSYTENSEHQSDSFIIIKQIK